MAEQDVEIPSSRSPVFASPDLMSRYLAAEINAHRGRLEEALDDYWVVAQASLDPMVVRRAARIALHLSSERALPAVELWVRVSPDAIDAHQALLLLHLKEGQQEKALAAAEELMRAAAIAGKDGYLEIAAVAAVATVSGDVDKAVTLLEAVAEKNSEDSGSYYALGVALFGMKEYVRAESALRQAIDLHKDDARYWMLLSRLLSVQEQFDEAEKVLSQAVSHHPEERILQLAYASSLVTHNKYQAAFEVYRNMLKAEPDDPELLQTAGVLAIELTLWPEARLYLEKLLEYPKMRDHARLLLGKVELGVGDVDAASDYFNRVQGELQGEAVVQLAKIEFEAGRIESGHKLFDQQRLAEPEQAIAYYLAEAELLKSADYIEEGLAVLATAIEIHPDDLDLLYAHGMLSIDNGDIVTLEKRMREIIAADPDNALALNALGYTLADETDRYAEALELITKALQLMPESPAILDSMGWVLFRMGRYDESISYLQQAAEINADGEITAHLGEVLWHSGKREEAMSVWKSGLEREPDNRHIVEAMKRLQP
ncbi:tetratricopeptide repeat protein [Solemya elarraichensis gill symbiont]|nr:tetratricopeptide repeat protein [Solemya elarraichensis gill symbiont]